MTAPDTPAANGPDDRPGRSPVPRLTLTQREAAAAVGCSVAFFRAHVLPNIKVARVGRRTLIPVRELERWIDDAAEPLDPHA